MRPRSPAPQGEAAIHAGALAVNHLNPTGESEIRQAIPLARAAAFAVKSRSESSGWRVGEFTGLPIAIFQNWLYEQNRSWRFTDGTSVSSGLSSIRIRAPTTRRTTAT
jgi:hypothetical protein